MNSNSSRMDFNNVYHSISIVLYGETTGAPPARELDATVINVIGQYGLPGTYREWHLSDQSIYDFSSRKRLTPGEAESLLSLCEASPEEALDIIDRIEEALAHRIDPSLTVIIPVPTGAGPGGSPDQFIRELRLSLNPQYTAVIMNTTSSRLL